MGFISLKDVVLNHGGTAAEILTNTGKLSVKNDLFDGSYDGVESLRALLLSMIGEIKKPFHVINMSFSTKIEKGRVNPIEIDSDFQPFGNFNSNYKHFAINCLVNLWHPNGIYPNEVEVLLFKPKPSFINPLVGLIPSPEAENHPPTDVVRVPEGQTGQADPTSSNYWTDYVKKYWTLVSGAEKNGHSEIKAAYSGDSIGEDWPGDIKRYHTTTRDEDEDGYWETVWPLHVATTLESLEQDFMILVRVRRYSRTAQRAFLFGVKGETRYVGEFQLGWIPRAIVYAPPGQDMTNSLIEETEHKTRITFDQQINVLEGTFSESGAGFGLEYGYAAMRMDFTDEWHHDDSTLQKSTRIIEITSTQKTVITADNQRAIGRKYWGPLSDLFVILAGPWFSVHQIFNERSYDDLPAIYGIGASSRTTGIRKLIIPTHLLLKPTAGSVAESIPWEERKRILALNPFVVRDETILDEVAEGIRDIREAVNPYVNLMNPINGTRRTIPIASLILERGSVIDYYQSQSVVLEEIDVVQSSYATTITHTTGFSVDIKIANVSIEEGSRFTIQYHTTSEARESNGQTKAAKCYLIRNQNDASSGEIDIFYDAMFGTFMFSSHPVSDGIIIYLHLSGMVTNTLGEPVPFEEVILTPIRTEKTVKVLKTMTDDRGEYFFRGLSAGDYKVDSGGVTVAFSVPSKLQKSEYFIKDIRQARKTLNVVNMRSTDIISLFKMPQESAFEIRGELKDIRTSNKFYKLLGLSKREITNLEKLYRLKLPPRQKRKKLSHRSKDSKKNS